MRRRASLVEEAIPRSLSSLREVHVVTVGELHLGDVVRRLALDEDAIEAFGGSVRGVLSVVETHDLLRERTLQLLRRELGRETLDVRVVESRREPEVLAHQLVRDAHQLAEHLVGFFGDPDVVPEALRHLLHAVGAFEQRHRHHDLWLLVVRPLEVSSDEEVEVLVGPADLDVGADGDRVVALQERVHELAHRDRLPRLVPLGEVVALEHPRDRVIRRHLEQSFDAEGLEPLGVAPDLEIVRERIRSNWPRR